MVKQLIEANIILLLSSRVVRNFHTATWLFISFDVDQITVDNGDIAQTRTQNILIENFVPRG